MAVGSLADYALIFSLNVAMLAGAWWVLLRMLEQAIKVWRLYKEEEK